MRKDYGSIANENKASNGNASKFEPDAVLRDLIGENPNMKTYRSVGRRLGELIQRKNPFTPAYFINVLAGRMDIGKPLYLALRTYWMHRNGVHPPFAGACEPVNAKALMGQVEEGAYILTSSIRCANPNCQTPFVPKVPWQRYCCTECRRKKR